MNGLTEFVARLKAWQVFLLLMLPIIAGQFQLVSSIPPPAYPPQPPSFEEFEVFFRRTILMTLVMVVLLLGWLLSIAFAANRRVEENLRQNTHLAVGSAAYAVAYIALGPYIWLSPHAFASGEGSIAVIIPLHLLAMIAIFYVLAFAARNLIMAERQSTVSFFDYSGPFFLMWFFAVGVWFVQPRVNRLVSGP